ncbi:MAG TPA: ABC transporter ATP-binding protein, partial [Planctomycetota bacterium]|nr:ABC transporter ATP-binding protein [Planctomycetota bacterium]
MSTQSATSIRRAITYYAPPDEQDKDQAPLQAVLVQRILSFTRPYAWKRNALFGLTFLRGLQLPALAWMIGYTLKGPISRRDPAEIAWTTGAYLALAVVTMITLHFRSRFALELGENVVHDLRAALFDKLMTMPMSFFNQTKFGRIISRMTSDIDNIRVGVQDVAFVMIVQGLQMMVSAALMAWYNWELFSIMLLMAPLIWIVNKRYRKEMSLRIRRMQESWSRMTSTLSESVSGIRVTQAFVRQEINSEFFSQLVDVHSQNNVGVARASAVYVPLLQLKSQLFLGTMALLGGYGALHGKGWMQVRVGDLVMFIFLANLFFEPVQVIGNQLNQAFTAMAGAERLFRLLDQKPEWVDASDARPLAPIAGRVEFKDVRFEYTPHRPVLADISFIAEPGQTVALVGHTGSGKTTLVGLLQKFY